MVKYFQPFCGLEILTIWRDKMRKELESLLESIRESHKLRNKRTRQSLNVLYSGAVIYIVGSMLVSIAAIRGYIPVLHSIMFLCSFMVIMGGVIFFTRRTIK